MTIELAVAGNGPLGTNLRVRTVSEDGLPGGQLVITVNRVLEPDRGSVGVAAGCLFAERRLADGTAVRGCLAAARYT